jgi:quinol---cytochrome c reductase iron-sulfur subunit, bacillus type
MERRTFLARVVQTISAAIGGLFTLPVLAFVRGSFSASKDDTYDPISRVQDLEEEVTRISFTRLQRDGWMVQTTEDYVWVRKKPDGGIAVYEPHCTHLGCAYSWVQANQRFECPCHGGKFDKEGNRIAGPPPRPLDRYEVKIEGNQIKIGKILKS